MELSIVIPCLNEADTLQTCIRKAKIACNGLNIRYEILIADNGSTDNSIKIAETEGVRIISVDIKGYGAALQQGIAAANGKFIIMGDADDSYDFLDIPKFYNELIKGFDIVQGCRLPAGGGVIEAGAMPLSHKYLGNPMFSFLARWWFKAPINDIYCGLRGFLKEYIQTLYLQSNGMEFATEMLIKASLKKAKIKEVPITLHKDGRKAHPPHLKTYRDGWRTLRFFLLYAPVWLYLLPSFVFGIATLGSFFTYAISGQGQAWSIMFGQFTFFTSYLFILTQIYLAKDGIIPPALKFVYKLEHGLLLSFCFIVFGIIIIFFNLFSGIFICLLGIQGMLGSFFASMLGEASFSKKNEHANRLQA